MNPTPDLRQRQGRPSRSRRPIEWPTVALACAIYGGWLLATFFHAQIPWPLRVGVGAWLIAWQGSLQHEAIHGHPTPWRRVNTALAAWPLSLWLPYALYRQSHLAHHAADELTLPGADPESRYISPAHGPGGRLRRRIHAAQSTLLGRLLVGPVIAVGELLAGEISALAKPGSSRARIWATHLTMVALVLIWTIGVCRISFAEYLLVFVYPGTALTLVRSFAEHRADADPRRRIAVVEHAPLLGLLFLNNNLHTAHHEQPALAWYRLPAAYRAHRGRLLKANGELVYTGYREVFYRYLFRPHDRLVHPALESAESSL